jgi:hypothetical protein
MAKKTLGYMALWRYPDQEEWTSFSKEEVVEELKRLVELEHEYAIEAKAVELVWDDEDEIFYSPAGKKDLE